MALFQVVWEYTAFVMIIFTSPYRLGEYYHDACSIFSYNPQCHPILYNYDMIVSNALFHIFSFVLVLLWFVTASDGYFCSPHSSLLNHEENQWLHNMLWQTRAKLGIWIRSIYRCRLLFFTSLNKQYCCHIVLNSAYYPVSGTILSDECK